MNSKHLSLESNGIIIKAKGISSFLKIDLERMVAESSSETEYLSRVSELLANILEDQNLYMEDWLIEERFDERRLKELFQYVESVRFMSPTVKIYDTNYRRVSTARVNS